MVLVALKSLCDWRRCCDCCSKRTVFDTVILTEEEKVLKEILKEAGKEELTRIILNKIAGNEHENEWNECDVAAGMIENFKKPKLSKEQQKKWRELQEGQVEETDGNTPEGRRVWWRYGIL